MATRQSRGPSPRGWGKRFHGGCYLLLIRAIPTRVGKTHRSAKASGVDPGHPHAGGENPHDRVTIAGENGPSPRGWGKPPSFAVSRARIRAIPTRVGKTPDYPAAHHASAGHPHAGGENFINFRLERLHNGPSPRGWGKRAFRNRARANPRAIPTRVGKTFLRSSGSKADTGHPHAGGENKPFPEFLFPGFGPSPRGWGKPRKSLSLETSVRAIPTRVGKTSVGFG